MKFRIGLASLGLTILLLGSTVARPPRAAAQDVAPDTAKRKVKTRVSPEYPLLAKQMNVTGHVKIEVTIAVDGKVTGTKVIGGNPVLVSSSLDALKKWHFEPGPKQTTEVIEFEFNGQN